MIVTRKDCLENEMKKLNEQLLNDAIDLHVSTDVAEGRVLGAALSVSQDGNRIYRKCWGNADIERSCSVTPRTVFRMASMTKPITAVMTLILNDRGLLDLDQPIFDYLPQFKSMPIARIGEDGMPHVVGNAQTPITARQILSHSSGIGCGELFLYYYPKFKAQEMLTLTSSVEAYSKLPLSFEPFSTCAYSATAAFDVLARIMEMIADMPYEELLKKELFNPCNMPDTNFTPSEDQWARMVEMHNYQNGEAVKSPTVPGCVFEGYPTTHAAAGAGLISTLEDYCNFMQLLHNGGTFEGERILSAKALSQMSAPQIRKDANTHWGLGVRVITSDAYGALPIGTFGWSGAYGTHFWIDPVNKIKAIYLKNSRFDGGSGNKTGKQLERDVANALTESLI